MRLAQADLPKLEALISSHDLIISLLPWTQHLPIAKLAIKHKKHFATTSYIADEMQVNAGRPFPWLGRPLSGAVVGRTEGMYSQCGCRPRPHPGLGSPLSTCPHLHPDRDPIAVCSSRIGSIASNTNDTRRPASQRYSRGTHVVHTGYSRGTHGVLTGYSRGTHGYSRGTPESARATHTW